VASAEQKAPKKGRSGRLSNAGEEKFIREYLGGSILTKVKALETLVPGLGAAGRLLADRMAKGGQWLIFGNGGSAADAQHLATEMTGRLHKLERRGLPALALTTDASALTSIGNDYGFERVFSRQIEALGRKGDVALGITTSGNSPNVLMGLAQARRQGMATIAFSGRGGGAVSKKGVADLCLIAPSDFTPHVQECHGSMGHILCFLVERGLERRGLFQRMKKNG